MRYLIFYIATLIAFVAIDFIWLTQMNARLYKPVLGDLLAEQPRLSAAVAFYLIYVAGITIFVGIPGLQSQSWRHVSLYGALLGLFCYATYDLTNQATLKHWSIQLTLADIGWGMALTASAATIGLLASRLVVRM